MVFEYIFCNIKSTYDEMAEKLEVSRDTIRRSIKALKEKGLISRVGSDKTGHWIILK